MKYAVLICAAGVLLLAACTGRPGVRDPVTYKFETCGLFGAYDENMTTPSLYMDGKYGKGLGKAGSSSTGSCDTDCFSWGDCTPEVRQSVYDDWFQWNGSSQ